MAGILAFNIFFLKKHLVTPTFFSKNNTYSTINYLTNLKKFHRIEFLKHLGLSLLP